MSTKRTVPVTIQGKQYRIRADADEQMIARAALLLDDTMTKVRERSTTADSVDVAVLAALNLANRLTAERTSPAIVDGAGERIAELIRLLETALGDAEPARS